MDALIFSLNAVLPLVLTVALGYLLKRMGLIPLNVSQAINKLVFRVFLPSMLFLNVYKIKSFSISDIGFIGYVMIAVALTFLVMIPIVSAFTKDGKKRGVLLQGSFRTNYALIGIPLATSIAGEAGALIATVLSAIVVPFYNVLAVISLSIFGDGKNKPSVKKIILGILKNPLIDSIALGFVFLGIRAICNHYGATFAPENIKPIWSVVQNMGSLATPLALISLGAQFEFSAVKELRRELTFSLVTRTLIMPLLGIGIAYLCFSKSFDAGQFAALIAVFATPVAVSSVPMTQEMGGDSALAGQIVVFTTIFSVLSVFVSCFLLRFAGIF